MGRGGLGDSKTCYSWAYGITEAARSARFIVVGEPRGVSMFILGHVLLLLRLAIYFLEAGDHYLRFMTPLKCVPYPESASSAFEPGIKPGAILFSSNISQSDQSPQAQPVRWYFSSCPSPFTPLAPSSSSALALTVPAPGPNSSSPITNPAKFPSSSTY